MFKNRKMMRISLLLIGLMLVAGSSAFVVQRALAGSCFPDVANGSWSYVASCWMKNKGISTGYSDGTFHPEWNVNRGEMALFLQRAFTNTTMVDFLTVGPTGWTANDAYNGYVGNYYYWSHLYKGSAGFAAFHLSPALPTSLYNTQMYVRGVKVCYDAAMSGTSNGYLDFIEIRQVYYTAGGAILYKSAINHTDTNGVGCTLLNFASPSDLIGVDQIVVILGVNYYNTSYSLAVGTTTVIVQPSTGLAVLGMDDLEAAMLERGGIITTEYDPATGILP